MSGSLSDRDAHGFPSGGYLGPVLDAAREPVFDAVARCAAEVVGFPGAAVAFVDGPRRWCKARVGGLPPEWVGDGPPGYYVGHSEVVRAPDGAVVGAVAVLDRRPRRVRAPQVRVLAALARLVDALLASRLALPSSGRRSLVGAVHVDQEGRALDGTASGSTILQVGGPTGRPAHEGQIEAEARILELVARGSDLPAVLGAVLGMIQDRLELSASAVLLAGDDGRLSIAAQHGVGSTLLAALDGLTPDADGPPPAASAARHQRVVISDLTHGTGPTIAAAQAGFAAWWSFPLVSDVDGRVAGTLEVFPRRPGRPDPAGAQLLALAAQLATVGIERVRAEASLAHRATHDDVTGLANRALVQDRLGSAPPDATSSTAMVLCEVGGIQPVRDSFGHDVGDDLLVAVADRLRGCVRVGDIACRLGSEDFAVLVDPCPHLEHAVGVAQRFLAAMGEPFPVYGREVFLDLRIGIAARRPAEGQRGRLLFEADAAMRQVDPVAGGFKIFEPQMLHRMLAQVELEAGLRRAIKRSELALHYQPKIDLESGQTIGFEALARWHHPQRGPIEPAVFIPLAEDTGLIGALGLWAHTEASTQLAAWTAATPEAAALHVAVNVSTRQLHMPRFASTMASLAADAGVDPERIVLEITEGALAHDNSGPIAVVRQLHELGFRISIDDFGTGYSSLARLSTFPVDELKIDRAFIAGLDSSESSAAIATAIIEMGHSLGCHVTAEGVETRAQLEFLRAHNCDIAQGYLLGRPSPADEINPC